MARDEFQPLMTRFFLEYLPRTRGLSANTAMSYRDSIALFLRWAEDEDGIPADKMAFRHLTADRVERFMNHLEATCSPSTCNNRLAGLKAFCRFAQRESPAALDACAGVLAVKAKKAPEPAIGYLSAEGVRALLRSAAVGSLRDLALVSVMNDLGLRAQETCDLKVGDLHLEKPATALVTGKGSKTRIVPMTPQVAAIASKHVDAAGLGPDDPLFPNRKGAKMMRSGVRYVVEKHAHAAAAAHPDAIAPNVTPAHAAPLEGDAPAGSRRQPHLHTRLPRSQLSHHDRDIRKGQSRGEAESHREGELCGRRGKRVRRCRAERTDCLAQEQRLTLCSAVVGGRRVLAAASLRVERQISSIDFA